MTQYFIESQAYYVRTEFADTPLNCDNPANAADFGGSGKSERKTD